MTVFIIYLLLKLSKKSATEASSEEKLLTGIIARLFTMSTSTHAGVVADVTEDAGDVLTAVDGAAVAVVAEDVVEGSSVLTAVDGAAVAVVAEDAVEGTPVHHRLPQIGRAHV